MENRGQTYGRAFKPPAPIIWGRTGSLSPSSHIFGYLCSDPVSLPFSQLCHMPTWQKIHVPWVWRGGPTNIWLILPLVTESFLSSGRLIWPCSVSVPLFSQCRPSRGCLLDLNSSWDPVANSGKRKLGCMEKDVVLRQHRFEPCAEGAQGFGALTLKFSKVPPAVPLGHSLAFFYSHPCLGGLTRCFKEHKT